MQRFASTQRGMKAVQRCLGFPNDGAVEVVKQAVQRLVGQRQQVVEQIFGGQHVLMRTVDGKEAAIARRPQQPPERQGLHQLIRMDQRHRHQHRIGPQNSRHRPL